MATQIPAAMRASELMSGTSSLQQGTLSIAGSSALTSNAVTVANYDLQSTHTLNSGGSKSLKVTGTFTLGSGGLLEVNDNALIVQSTTSNKSTVMATLASGINAAKNGGTWDGTAGITSATAAGRPDDLTLAMVDNAALPTPLTSFGGQSVNSSSVLVKVELLGDGDLSGIVDASDYDIWHTHVGTYTYAFNLGDFDGSGIVDASDFDMWISHVGFSYPLMPAFSSAAAPVPEPASLGVLMGGGGLLVRRRRERR